MSKMQKAVDGYKRLTGNKKQLIAYQTPKGDWYVTTQDGPRAYLLSKGMIQPGMPAKKVVYVD